MKFRLPLLIILAAVLVLCVAGCSEKKGRKIAAPAPARKVAPLPTAKPITRAKKVEKKPSPQPKYVYNPAGHRDPFQALVMVRKPLLKAVPQTPLQKYSLAQLRLIGLIIGKGRPRAMVQAPDGKAYILKPGTRIGKNGGRVAAIKRTAVVVEERYRDYLGQVKTSTQEIKLPKREGVE
jgi:type IV pilus assembly protein PilP